jgi:integrase
MEQELEVPRELLARMQPWKAEQIMKSRSLSRLAVRVYRKGGSPATVGDYVKNARLFCRWLNLEPDEALAGAPRRDWPRLVNEYLDYYVVKQGNAKTSARTMVAAIRKWLETNDVLSSRDLRWQGVDVPRYVRGEVDQIPTKLEIRAALSGGKARDRALVLMALSSGLRRGSLLGLRFGDVDLQREVPVIRPRPETTKGRSRFFTFCTPEAKEALMVYRREREMRGETVTPGSFVFTVERPRGAPYMSGLQASARWLELLRKSGLGGKGNRHSKMHFHVLRKFYKSWCSLSGVNSDVIEYTMGHRNSLAQTYFVGDAENVSDEVVRKLEAEYRKAIPALTVMSDEEKVRDLEAKVEEQAKKLAEEKGRFEYEKASWERRFEELRAMILAAKDADLAS